MMRLIVIHIIFIIFIIFLFLQLSWLPVSAINPVNPLDRVVSHAHLRDGRLHACPDDLCEMDTTTKLYFWIRKGDQIPNMYLQTESNAVTIATTRVRHPALRPRLTRKLKEELLRRSQGAPLEMLEAEFPNDQMIDTTYTFLMTTDYVSWIAAHMTCQRVNRLFERFRRGHRLACHLDKTTWRPSGW